MKTAAFLVIFLIPFTAPAQGRLEPRVYHWGEKVHDTTSIGTQVDMHTGTKGEQQASLASDELLIIRQGNLMVTIGDSTRVLGPGSIAYIQPGEKHLLKASRKSKCKYLVINIHQLVDLRNDERSVMVDWEEMKFTPHDKGGRRNVVDMPTGSFTRFEMHVTTLNPGLSSHDPHSHTPEEMILIKEGNVEMNVGNRKIKASEGDLIFLESKILHNLTNVGTTPTTYYAFQWN